MGSAWPVRRSASRTLLAGTICASLLRPWIADAQPLTDPAAFDRTIQPYLQEAPAPKKALVIGIVDYVEQSKLPAAKADADGMEKELSALHFAVTRATALDRGGLITTVKTFAASLEEGDIAVVYFSGHGMQYANFNYLLPADTPSCMASEEDVVHKNIPVTMIMERVIEKRVGFLLVILDACRTAPVLSCPPAPKDTVRAAPRTLPPTAATGPTVQPPQFGASKGLAAINPATMRPQGATGIAPSVVVAFAASPGTPAWEGADTTAGSLYSRHLRTKILKTSKDHHEIFAAVRLGVRTDSSGKQEPKEEEGSYGPLYFELSEDARTKNLVNWKGALELAVKFGDTGSVEQYVTSFPSSQFAAMARKWLRDRAHVAAKIALTPSRQPQHVAFDLDTALKTAMAKPPHAVTGAPSMTVAAHKTAPANEPGNYWSIGELQRGMNVPAVHIDTAAKTSKPTIMEQPTFKMAETRAIAVEAAAPTAANAANTFDLKVRGVDGFTLTGAGTAGATDQPSLKDVLGGSYAAKAGPKPTTIATPTPETTVEIVLSSVVEPATSQGQAQALAFQRSLEIRKQLYEQGYDPKNVVVFMPTQYLYGDRARAEPAKPRSDLIRINDGKQ